MSLRKLCVFLFVNCIFIFRIANIFVASYAMKYSEIFFVIRKFLAYTPPTIHASYGPVRNADRVSLPRDETQSANPVVRFERDFNINTLVYIHVAPSFVIVNIGNS